MIPELSVFTPPVSCLATFSLPWFMNLAFQVPMQYCSLQHQTLLSPPDTPTAGWCLICLGLFILSGAISLLFPSSKSDTYQPGGLILLWHLFLPFKGFLRQETGVGCHSLLQQIMFCQMHVCVYLFVFLFLSGQARRDGWRTEQKVKQACRSGPCF